MTYRLVVNPGQFNIDEDFWKLNPQLRYMSPFRELYDADEMPGKVHSSKTMWCVWLLCDPSYDNKVFRMLAQDQDEIVKLYYPKFERKHDMVVKIMDKYDELLLTPVARAFKDEEQSMTDRARFLRETLYSLDTPVLDEDGEVVRDSRGNPIMVKGTATQLDAMRKNSLTIAKNYAEIRSLFEKEQEAVRIHGGRSLTPREQGRMLQDIKEDYERDISGESDD